MFFKNTDVKHLRDEIHVLREDIDQMTQEIDGLSNGRGTVFTVCYIFFFFFFHNLKIMNMVS